MAEDLHEKDFRILTGKTDPIIAIMTIDDSHDVVVYGMQEEVGARSVKGDRQVGKEIRGSEHLDFRWGSS